MRIITFNANGIRSAARKGFFDWLPAQQADVVCVQETKAQVAQLADPIFWPQGWNCYYSDAEKKGYSGVALYARRKPDAVEAALGCPACPEFETEGRWLEARFGALSVISLYMPSGSSGEERQQIKYRLMDCLYAHLDALRGNGRSYIVCADWNIVHTAADIKNWRGNQKNSGCLPEERAWLDRLFGELGYVDAFRQLEQAPEQYTWWSNRGQAWAKNVGWRIDYQVVSPTLADKVLATHIYREQRFSDHAPLTIDYAWSW
ncbi:exodeoxyribonuclease III [Acidihalobacter ferrooxydans]|uniref:Exodeoxyribonuclease III n=1 Tax=Acidihalobacter ferrooxydans TaxID=1765967 RepID=A0A1P8UD90_9GAMM|nr:exodeoxyribonuclease III [Acidihalobacter ferrooxydans]APZ41754.1 exodeoxyribonuclease III [Acidihalobacter ferrooxydans]